MKKRTFVILGVLATGGLIAAASSISPSKPSESIECYSVQNVMVVQMTGAEEAPNPGDPDGSGTATFRLNMGAGTIDYTLTVQNIDPATAAHIHLAPPGQAGPVVVPLNPPTNGTVSGTAQVGKEVMKAIHKNPSAYYVNVHNATYPGGAVRGQLSKK